MTDMEVVGMLAEAVLSGDDERTLRVGYEVMIAAEYGEQEGAYELYTELAGQYRAPIPVLMAQLAAIMGHDTSDRLGEVTAPTLVIHGTADRLMEVENGELIARLIPGARLELLEGSGHMFFWEQPERSAQLVREHAASAVGAQRERRLSTARRRGAGATSRASGCCTPSSSSTATMTLRRRSRSSLVAGARPARRAGCRGRPRVSLGVELGEGLVEARMLAVWPARARSAGARPSAAKLPATLRSRSSAASASPAAVLDLREREVRVGVGGLELEDLAQRLLVAGVEQRWVSVGTRPSKNSLDLARALGADELGGDLAVDERLDGGDALDAELLRRCPGSGRCRSSRARPCPRAPRRPSRAPGRAGGRARTTAPRSPRRPAAAPIAAAPRSRNQPRRRRSRSWEDRVDKRRPAQACGHG